MFQNVGEMVVLFWRTVLSLPLAWRHRRKVADQFFEVGPASLLMVCILSFFIGGVLSLLLGPAMVERGVGNSVGGIVGLGMCKELSPVIMSILIAGRIGSAMAAEIGSMRVYQEIDALRTMNINPVHYLVLPRFVALVLGLPMLVMVSVLVGWGGGALVAAANHSIDISIQPFFEDLKDFVDFKDVATGLLKSFVFAIVIAIVSCHQGLVTIGGPRGVGRSVTKAVVNCIVMIVILDYIVTRVTYNGRMSIQSSFSAAGGLSVKVTGLHKRFENQEILKGVDFEVNPGEIFVIMGPSGSGKSVLLKHLIGLEKPDAGDILIDGKSIKNAAVLETYRLAMVFQSGALLNSLTVAENVGLYLAEHRLKPPEEIARIVNEKLGVVGLTGQGDKLPGDLSGGMKKRAAIARALVIEPQLMLYDEPTSELDPLSAITVAGEILHLQRRIGVTSIIVSHDRELAFGVAERIAVLNEGRVLAIGTPEDIKANPDPLIQRFLNTDFKTAITKGNS